VRAFLHRQRLLVMRVADSSQMRARLQPEDEAQDDISFDETVIQQHQRERRAGDDGHALQNTGQICVHEKDIAKEREHENVEEEIWECRLSEVLESRIGKTEEALCRGQESNRPKPGDAACKALLATSTCSITKHSVASKRAARPSRAIACSIAGSEYNSTPAMKLSTYNAARQSVFTDVTGSTKPRTHAHMANTSPTISVPPGIRHSVTSLAITRIPRDPLSRRSSGNMTRDSWMITKMNQRLSQRGMS